MLKIRSRKNKFNQLPVFKPNYKFGFLCFLLLKVKNTLERAGSSILRSFALLSPFLNLKPITRIFYYNQNIKGKTLSGNDFIAIILIFILISLSSCIAYAFTDDQIANAIYQAEGGAKTKFPYGVKSIDTKGDKDYARKICLNTIRNNRIRFANQTKYKDYIEFLGSRFCPVSAHKLNVNWVKNVKWWLNQ